MFQNASRIVAVLLGLLDQHLYLFHTPSQRDESQGQSLSTAYWWPIAPQYPPSRGWHHPSSFQEQPSIAQSDYIYYGTPGSPIFKAVQQQRCKASYTALPKSLKSPEYAVGEGSERSHVDQPVAVPP